MSRPIRTTRLQDDIYADLAAGEKTNAELQGKYKLTYEQLVRQMDSLGISYPVYNPRPGVWAVLKDKDYEKLSDMYQT